MDSHFTARIAVLTGAGISAESGLRTFRDSNGLWEEHAIEDVATPEAWQRNPELVTRFYNMRREQLATVQPNAAHVALAKLEQYLPTVVITQNVDDLHERAGSKNLVHLHGELVKMRSVDGFGSSINVGYKAVPYGLKNEAGHLLRPDIVWFGESVPLIETAAALFSHAEIVLVVGTSLQVYPAAGLLHAAPYGSEIYYIDPSDYNGRPMVNLKHLKESAALALPRLVDELIQRLS
jgi:NAD-dependent deacetylase